VDAFMEKDDDDNNARTEDANGTKSQGPTYRQTAVRALRKRNE